MSRKSGETLRDFGVGIIGEIDNPSIAKGERK